jgi:hypothetical protein
MMLSQLQGINTVIYYAPTILKFAGFCDKQAVLGLIAIDTVNVLMTVLSVLLIERLGRRTWLLIGSAGMLGSLLMLSFAFTMLSDSADDDGSSLSKGSVATVALALYVAFFAASWGPIGWLYNSEIYPTSVRGVATGIASFVNWTSNFFVSITFLEIQHGFKTIANECSDEQVTANPMLCPTKCNVTNATVVSTASSLNATSAGGGSAGEGNCSCGTVAEGHTFVLYAAWAAVAMLFVWFYVIETQGKSLERIQEEFEARAKSSRCCCSSPSTTAAYAGGVGGESSAAAAAAQRNEQYRRPSRDDEIKGLIREEDSGSFGNTANSPASSGNSIAVAGTRHATSL